MKKRLIAAPKVDESEISYEVNDSQMVDIKGDPYNATTINLLFNGEYAGYLIFSVYPEEERLYIENIEVDEVHQGLGLAQYMYKKFGELYSSQYNAWIVEREFQNPVAESAFRKAIDLGWVPQEALNESYTNRTY